jgi:uncharacterized protein DUF4159
MLLDLGVGGPRAPLSSRRSSMAVVSLLALATGLALAASGDQRRMQRNPFMPPAPRIEPAAAYDGSFQFCRGSFRTTLEGDGDGWYVDYPMSEENLSTRLAEVTKTRVQHDFEGAPVHQVVPLSDPALFECPFVMMSEPGGAFFDEDEAAHLREYLLKGGFLWVDDFWGSRAWEWWASQIGKALPPGEYPIVDIPMTHPILHSVIDVDQVPQVPNVGLWHNMQLTSERGADSAEVHFRGIADRAGRLIVVMTHNSDFGDAFERERDSPDYFRRFSVPGYAIGIDIIVYALTH